MQLLTIFIKPSLHRIFVIHVAHIIHIFIVTLVHVIFLSLIWTPQPRIVPSRLNHNGHLTNSTTLPWVNYVRYMV